MILILSFHRVTVSVDGSELVQTHQIQINWKILQFKRDWEREAFPLFSKVLFEGIAVIETGIWEQTTTVALKKLHKNEEQEFQREVSVLKSLNHPNIVRFLGLYTTEGQHFIVTEYMSAGWQFLGELSV